MTGVNIPDEVLFQACGAAGYDRSDEFWGEVVELVRAAAPLILAAELDSLAGFFASAASDKETRFEARQAEVTAADAEWDEDGVCQNLAGYTSAYGNVARHLRRRAAELRGEG